MNLMPSAMKTPSSQSTFIASLKTVNSSETVLAMIETTVACCEGIKLKKYPLKHKN
jgi:hypothetical protein